MSLSYAVLCHSLLLFGIGDVLDLLFLSLSCLFCLQFTLFAKKLILEFLIILFLLNLLPLGLINSGLASQILLLLQLEIRLQILSDQLSLLIQLIFPLRFQLPNLILIDLFTRKLIAIFVQVAVGAQMFHGDYFV